MSKGKYSSTENHADWSRKPVPKTNYSIHQHAKLQALEKYKHNINLYHLVKDTIRNPRKTVSSRIGARTPVIPTK